MGSPITSWNRASQIASWNRPLHALFLLHHWTESLTENLSRFKYANFSPLQVIVSRSGLATESSWVSTSQKIFILIWIWPNQTNSSSTSIRSRMLIFRTEVMHPRFPAIRGANLHVINKPVPLHPPPITSWSAIMSSFQDLITYHITADELGLSLPSAVFNRCDYTDGSSLVLPLINRISSGRFLTSLHKWQWIIDNRTNYMHNM